MILKGNNNAPFPAGCGNFNRVDRYISQTDVTGLFPKTSEWTLILWAKTSLSSGQAFLVSYRKSGGNTLFVIYILDGELRAYVAGNVISTSEDVSDSTWKLIVAQNISDGEGGYDLNIYINNSLAGSSSFGSDTEVDPSLYIGHRGEGNASTYGWNGNISGIFYYSDILTNAELSNIYTYGAMKLPSDNLSIGFPLCEQTGSAAYDVSGNGNHGTWNGTSSFYTTQEEFLYPKQKGYSKYTKTGEDNLFVPYGIDGDALTITPPSGYTKAFDAPA